jgi:hypothetical protein
MFTSSSILLTFLCSIGLVASFLPQFHRTRITILHDALSEYSGADDTPEILNNLDAYETSGKLPFWAWAGKFPEPNKDIWPGDRPPLSQIKLYAEKMDAAWGRGKFRSEVWEDDVNPLNNWSKNYEITAEQLEALKQGFDFTNPKPWFEKRGIKWEDALAKYNAAIAENLKIYEANKANEPPVSIELFDKIIKEFDTAHANMVALQAKFDFLDDVDESGCLKSEPAESPVSLAEFKQVRAAYDTAFANLKYEMDRIQDLYLRYYDELGQIVKGQPSLTLEDDGRKFLNAK